MYETSHKSESCGIRSVTVGVFKLIASVHCSQSVFEVGTIKSFDFFMMSTVPSFPGKSFKNIFSLLTLRLAKLPRGL